MSAEKKQHIISALSKLKQKVIWKWDEEVVGVDKEQFMIRNWLPQDEILSHENVKLFVTHGGLLSATEAIVRGKQFKT
jgi:glucuronosyltransferase